MRILFDITETKFHRNTTGIQRVVRKVAQELYLLSEKRGFSIELVSLSKKGIHLEDAGLFFEHQTSLLDSTSSAASKLFRISQITGNVIRDLRLGAVLDWKPARDLGRKIYSSEFEKNQEKQILKAAEVDLNETIFISLDTFWGRDPLALLALGRYKIGGLRVHVMLHDLIPVTHRDYVSDSFHRNFSSSLTHIVKLADKLLFPSRAALDAAVQHLHDHTSLEMSVVTLGVDSPNVPSEIAAGFVKTNNSVVAVGTIDRRKNYGLLVRWFREFGHDEYSLTIIGRSNGTCKELEQEMVLLEQMFGNFKWMQNATDDQMSQTLHQSAIGVSASIAEGFGLPTLEMAAHGCKLLLADIPVNREVAPIGTVFFDPFSISAFKQGLIELKTAQPIPFKAPTWKMTAEQLLLQAGI